MYERRCICDVCGKKDADKSFKIKCRGNKWWREKPTSGRWFHIDVCDRCYYALLALMYDKDRLVDVQALVEESAKMCYQDDDKRSAYMNGAQFAIEYMSLNKTIQRENK